jgi:bacterioferritin
MQGHPEVVQGLNQCLKDQLTAINQFFLHARITKDWGLEEFNDAEYKTSIHAMKAADKLIERVLFLDGLPNLQDLGKLLIGENVPEILNGDLKLMIEMRTRLQAQMKVCEDVRDYISRDLLEDLLEDTEEQIDWIETQQWLIRNVGLENYLQSQMDD